MGSQGAAEGPLLGDAALLATHSRTVVVTAIAFSPWCQQGIHLWPLCCWCCSCLRSGFRQSLHCLVRARWRVLAVAPDRYKTESNQIKNPTYAYLKPFLILIQGMCLWIQMQSQLSYKVLKYQSLQKCNVIIIVASKMLLSTRFSYFTLTYSDNYSVIKRCFC